MTEPRTPYITRADVTDDARLPNIAQVDKAKVNSASEHDEQVALFQWAATQPELRWMFAIPNGTRTTPGIARRMKAEGVRKGVADIFLPLPRHGYHGLWIEMKSRTGGAGHRGGERAAGDDYRGWRLPISREPILIRQRQS